MTPEEVIKYNDAADFLTRECALNLKEEQVANTLSQAIEYGNLDYWFNNPSDQQEVKLREIFITRAVFYLRNKFREK